MDENQIDVLSQFYQNTRYKDEFKTKSLIVDITISENDKSFLVKLPEELIINKISDVYLDTVITQNIVAKDGNSNGNYMGFLMGVTQIESKTVGGDETENNNKYNYNFFIPNEASTGEIRIHKGRKFNYVGLIRPGRYHEVPVKLTVLDGNTSIWGKDTCRFIAEFIIIEK